MDHDRPILNLEETRTLHASDSPWAAETTLGNTQVTKLEPVPYGIQRYR